MSGMAQGMERRPGTTLLAAARGLLGALTLGVVVAGLSGCGGGDGGGGGSGAVSPQPVAPTSNRARFLLNCDLNGVTGVLTMDVEIISNVGITFGSGPSPSITGVIGAGSNTIVTSGTVQSPSASYTFIGRDNFADFRHVQTNERFRVQWSAMPTGLTMIVNPFGPGTTTHSCVLRSASYL